MSADALVAAVATARHKFDGVDLKVGDPFECTESELADLRVLGFAQRAPTRPKPAPVEQERKPLSDESASAPPRIEAEAVAAGLPAATVDDSTPPLSTVATPQVSATAETRRTTRRQRDPT